MTDSVLRALRFMGSVKSLANVITTGGGENLLYPVNSAHGVATWTAESVAYTLSDETFAQITLSAFKAGTIIKVTEELLEDSAFPLDGFLATGVRRADRRSRGDRVHDRGRHGQAPGPARHVGDCEHHAGDSGGRQLADIHAQRSGYRVKFTLPSQYRADASWIVVDGAAKNMYLLVDT